MKTKKLLTRIITFSLALFTALAAGNVSAHAAVSGAKTVRVGYAVYEGYQQGGPGQTKSGSAYEYYQKIRYYTGWEYEYVYGNISEMYTLLEKGDIDIMALVPDRGIVRNRFLLSDKPHGTEPMYIYIHMDNTEITSGNIKSLNGKTIGIRKETYRRNILEHWCVQQGIKCAIKEYDNTEKLHDALTDKNIDAIMDTRVLDNHSYEHPWQSVYRFSPEPLYFAVNKDRPDILVELNEAQEYIISSNELYMYQLQDKYHSTVNHHNIYLTREEKEMVKNRGTIKIGYLEEFNPISFTDVETGKLSGIAGFYFDELKEKYGLDYEYHKYSSEIIMQYALLNKEIDLMLPIGYGLDIAEQLDIALSNPISTPSMSMFVKSAKDTEKITSIAVMEDSVTPREYIKMYFPQAEIVVASTRTKALQLVYDGKADCYIARTNSIPWIESSANVAKKLETIALPGMLDYCIAARIEDADILSVVNKGINMVTEAQLIDATAKYAYSGNDVSLIEAIKDNPVSVIAIAIAACSLFAVVFMIYKLKTESAYLKQVRSARDEARRAQHRAENAQQRAIQASNAKSSFMTSMSHDIRTPMNAIIGMTTLASKHLDNPDYMKNCLSRITLASNHLLTLINDVLDINKIETGKLNLNPTVFSLADSFMNIANISRPQVRAKNHRFEIRIHDVKNEYIFADELRINQIFINILANAIKYTPDNGHITVDVKQEKNNGMQDTIRLVYIVEDNGVGMSREFQSEMYAPFAQENRNVNLYGSGVGLTICKQLVDLMGGTIECDSRIGKGTRFTVTLDLPIAEKVMEETILPPMKILLVDDDEIFLSTASETLKDMGVSPDCATSGRQAVEIVVEKHRQNKDYPVIIIDWQMPGMDGIETTREIRRKIGYEVSIIVISAYDSEEIRNVAIEAGANGFISKPFFRSSVYRSMTEILNIKTGVSSSGEKPFDRLKGLNVIVAEDNELNREIARELLAMYDISTTRAENGQQCVDILNKAEQNEYDMVLMDIQMPVMDGYKATEAIRQINRNNIGAIPVIAMTANAFSEDVTACFKAGMDAHVAKPIDIEQLLETMERVLASKK